MRLRTSPGPPARLSVAECRRTIALLASPQIIAEDQLEALLSAFDEDGNDPQFRTRVLQGNGGIDLLTAVLSSHPSTGNGVISCAELTKLLRMLNPTWRLRLRTLLPPEPEAAAPAADDGSFFGLRIPGVTDKHRRRKNRK